MSKELSNTGFPVLYVSKETCCGCSACEAICPRGAITMHPDAEGFKYPVLNEQLCVKCLVCSQVCPFKSEDMQ